MPTISNSTQDHQKPGSAPAQDQQVPGLASQLARLLPYFLEMQIPMVLGALVCYLLGRLVAPSSGFATVYYPGSYLYAIGDVLYLSVPVAAWMILRGHGWRHTTEIMIAMLLPVFAIAGLGELGAYPYLRWLITAGYPVMCLGMLACMIVRRDHFGRPLKAILASRSLYAA